MNPSFQARTVEVTYLRPSIIHQSIAAAFGSAIRPRVEPLRVLSIVPREEARRR